MARRIGTRRERRRRIGFLRLGLALILLPLFCAAFFQWSNHSLQVTKWDAAFPDLPQGFDGCRIAVLSDLHGATFGKDGAALFRKVLRQKPDYILF